MSDGQKQMSVFEQIRAGLEDSIAHSRGGLSLVTTKLPAPPPQVRASEIVALRRRYRMSQGVFAAVLNVSPRTVQSWEQGARQPSDAALRMLQVIEQQPAVVTAIFNAKRTSGRQNSVYGERGGRRVTERRGPKRVDTKG